MQPKHLDYLFEKVERDAFKLEEIHGISAESLAEILKILHRTKNQGSISKHTSAPTESTHKYTGPFPIGKFYSHGVPLRACRDSSKGSQFLQFNKGRKLILTEKNGPVARGYIQSDPLKKQGEINLQDVQFDLRFDDEYFSEVDAFASSLEESCAQSIKQLAEHLTRRYEDSIIFQLRSIYTWICYHISYDAEGFFGPPEARASNEARDVLKTRLAVCAGYANLFHAICEAVPLLAREVRVKVVNGYGRGYGSTIHMEKVPRTNFGYSNHAWNSVFIDGHPFFVESTWGAGNLNGRTFIQKFSSSYFLSPPQDFVRLHFPSKASDQHLTPAITEKEFCSFPVLSAPFYKYDLALISHSTSPVTIFSNDFSGGKQMALKIKVPLEFGPHIRFTAKLSCDKPVGCSPDIDIFSQPSVEGWDFYIPLVFWELATLDVFLFDERINSSYGEMAMQFAIKFKLRAEDVDNYSAFPMCCNPSKSSPFILISPFACAQALNSTQTFKVRPRVLPTSKYDTDDKLYLMNPRRNASMLKFDWAEGVYSITPKLSIAGDWSIDLKVTNEMYYPLFKYVVS